MNVLKVMLRALLDNALETTSTIPARVHRSKKYRVLAEPVKGSQCEGKFADHQGAQRCGSSVYGCITCLLSPLSSYTRTPLPLLSHLTQRSNDSVCTLGRRHSRAACWSASASLLAISDS